MKINYDLHFAGGDRMSREFEYIEKWLVDETGAFKKGIDVGCGTNRLSMEILSLDQNENRKYAHADIVHNCANLEISKEMMFNGRNYKFEDDGLDFIFSSHCLEDFADIDLVFKNWWKKLKVDGLMILLLPDMEKCDCEICQSEDQKKLRAVQGMTARYWTLEDFNSTGKGNPTHKVNVGKKFITTLLQGFKEKNEMDYEILQMDTIPHNVSCSIDFVIKKLM